jgi:hypothetical protein
MREELKVLRDDALRDIAAAADLSALEQVRIGKRSGRPPAGWVVDLEVRRGADHRPVGVVDLCRLDLVGADGLDGHSSLDDRVETLVDDPHRAAPQLAANQILAKLGDLSHSTPRKKARRNAASAQAVQMKPGS